MWGQGSLYNRSKAFCTKVRAGLIIQQIQSILHQCEGWEHLTMDPKHFAPTSGQGTFTQQIRCILHQCQGRECVTTDPRKQCCNWSIAFCTNTRAGNVLQLIQALCTNTRVGNVLQLIQALCTNVRAGNVLQLIQAFCTYGRECVTTDL